MILTIIFVLDVNPKVGVYVEQTTSLTNCKKLSLLPKCIIHERGYAMRLYFSNALKAFFFSSRNMNKIEVHVIGDFQREKNVTGTLRILGRGTEHINVLVVSN